MDTPQFQTAEYAGAKASEVCKLCKQPIGAAYYRVGEAMACEACAQKATSDLPKDSHSAYSRGLLFGIGGAIVGLILYSAFSIITGLIIGYVSLAVGYIVGKAIKAGSRGLGGRRYQITAALLTYAAVSVAAIPIGISQIIKEPKPQATAQVSSQTSSNSGAEEPGPSNSEQQSSSEGPSLAHKGLGVQLMALLAIGLASPFLALQDPFHGIIGLVILAVGIRIAWQITDGKPADQITGPFQNRAAPQSPSSLG